MNVATHIACVSLILTGIVAAASAAKELLWNVLWSPEAVETRNRMRLGVDKAGLWGYDIVREAERILEARQRERERT